MTDSFDPTPYLRPPILNVASAVALASALLAATPPGSPAGVKKAAKKLRGAAVALQDAWATSDTLTATPSDARVADRAVDNGWSALYGRLESYAALPAERHPKAARAAELLNALFPDGLTFLKLPYAEEWAESKKRIDRIASESWAAEVDALAGKEFLVEIHATHAAYGKAIGATAARPETTEATRVAEPLRAVARAIGAYATQVVAAVDVEDDASIKAARTALRPLDAHRGSAPRRAKGNPPIATPTAIIPPVPA